ncbi:MAG: hypothetical protein VX834_13510, partial [Myxococcota bacterium]|nr:hypothetical protein [Myxococcota bacterium]
GTFEGNHAMGVWAHGEGVSLTLESTTIENTYAQPADGVGGRGLEIATGAHVTLKGVVLSSNREIGMGVFGEATRVDAEELVVLSTKHSEKLESDGSAKFGYGVVVAGATVNLLDFQLSENASVGLQLLDSSPCVEQFGGLPIVQCADGLISANDIGVNNQLEELPIEEIFSNVIMQDNITEDLSSANLPTGCQSEN